MRKVLVFAVFLIACGSTPPPKQKKLCDSPEPGQALSQAQCECREGRVVLSVGRAVEVHCEPDEHEIGSAKIGDRDGWCCQ
jgi:hypothetical protein